MWRSVGLRLGQHRKWGANLNPALAEHLLLAGISATALHFLTYAWICYQARYIHIFCTTVKAAQLFCLFLFKKFLIHEEWCFNFTAPVTELLRI